MRKFHGDGAADEPRGSSLAQRVPYGVPRITDLGVATRGGPLNFFIPVTDLEKYVPVDFE
jgi:hypothetical protein